jgi:murein L,D-transpeptidase YcbB/YkuD
MQMRIRAGAVLLGILSMTTLGAGCAPGVRASGQDPDPERAAYNSHAADGALREALQSTGQPAYVTSDDEGARLWKQTRTFYEKRQFAPAWIERGSPGPQVDDLIAAINAADGEGLDPQLYNARLLEERRQAVAKGFSWKKGLGLGEAAAMDMWLTYLYMQYASDVANGMSDIAHADASWKIKPEVFDPLDHLEKALHDNRVAESLAELTPASAGYRDLRKALVQYRAYAEGGKWPTVPANPKLKPGQQSDHVPAIARRLTASGDYSGPVPADGAPAAYTPDLEEAVKRFQRRHGLADDGVVGAAVAAEMNVPLDARIRQIELNLERWRWLPRKLGDRYILVNIPEMRLDVWDRGTVPLTMRVIVGKTGTPTPIFNDVMTHIVFSPYWNVPPTIAKAETLPSMMKDPGFLDRMNMEIVDGSGNRIDPASLDLDNPGSYRFRQRPGSSNSLGLVKFMFPNQFNVYLHDTPADSLFARASRSFSHGCVRLEQPGKLAEYLLSDQPEWTSERIGEAMDGGQERTVKLKDVIPVYIGYWTTGVSSDGLVQFRKDVYGIDGRLTTRLAERRQQLRTSAMAAATVLNPNQPVHMAGR